MSVVKSYLIVTSMLFASGCAGDARSHDDLGKRPEFIRGPILHAQYDGVTNDLLTGGLGATGLQAAAPPTFADPLNPSSAELRTRAIYNNYRALVDMTTKGGYGVLYGPNIDLNGGDTLGEGEVAGAENFAAPETGSGPGNVPLLVQLRPAVDSR